MARSRTSAQPTNDFHETQDSVRSQDFGSNTERLTRLKDSFSLIVQGELKDAQNRAHLIAVEGRANGEQDVPNWAGLIWQTAQALSDTQDALSNQNWTKVKTQSHRAAERTRDLLKLEVINSADAKFIETAAGGYWTMADNAQKEESSSELPA